MVGPPSGAPSQMVSPEAHKSSVLGAYNGPIAMVGAPYLLEEFARRLTEQGHRGDMVGHLGWQRRRNLRGGHARRYFCRGDETGHHRTLRETTENRSGCRGQFAAVDCT